MENASKPSRKFLRLKLRLSLWIGLGCIAQFFICGLVGVIRGYSIQSLVPVFIMVLGITLVQYSMTGTFWTVPKERRRHPFTKIFWFCTIFLLIAELPQGRYCDIGYEFYGQGNYSAAIVMYQKEIDTWYFRLIHNTFEGSSLAGIGDCYRRMGNFERALQTYQRLFEIGRGWHKHRALMGLADCYCHVGDFKKARQANEQLLETTEGYDNKMARQALDKLDKGLKELAGLEERLSKEELTDEQKADMLFEMADVYKTLDCDLKANEQYTLIRKLDISPERIEEAKKHIRAPNKKRF